MNTKNILFVLSLCIINIQLHAMHNQNLSQNDLVETVETRKMKPLSRDKEAVAINDMYKEPIKNLLPLKQQQQQKELPPYFDSTKKIFENQLLEAMQRKLELKKAVLREATPENRQNYQQAKIELNFANDNLNNLMNLYNNTQ